MLSAQHAVAMPYVITFWSPAYLSTTGKTTVYKETAAEAWMLVQELTASDEAVEISAPNGRVIERQELRALAEREAH